MTDEFADYYLPIKPPRHILNAPSQIVPTRERFEANEAATANGRLAEQENRQRTAAYLASSAVLDAERAFERGYVAALAKVARHQLPKPGLWLRLKRALRG